MLQQIDLNELKLNQNKLPAEFLQYLHIQVEKAKREICQSGSCELNIVWQDRSTHLQVTGETFETVVEPLLDRLVHPIKTALRDAKLRVSDIDEIVLVGGATRMPCIKKLATRLFQRFPASGVDPDEVVAMGAGIQAGLKLRDAMLDDLVLTDVCPYTLGIEVAYGDSQQGGYFSPIIERNNYIPVSRVDRFSTISNFQKVIEINIYQGESPSVSDNIFLGKMNIKVPKAEAGQEQVDVRFTYDINGILEVIVTVLSTQESHQRVIEGNPGVLTKAEIAERLKALEAIKIHPRELQENLVLINRAERLYRELLGHARQQVSALLANFNAVLDDQDPKTIAAARKQMTEILDQFEGDFKF